MGAGFSKRSGNEGVGRRHSWAAQQNAPVSLYKSFGGSFNQLQCVLHEFGSNHKCRSENYLKQKGNGAIVGLHSNWIGDFILACARPTDRIIRDHHLIHQFQSQNIGAVINLQEPGEHAGCGDGVIRETGFAYNPALFTRLLISIFHGEGMTSWMKNLRCLSARLWTLGLLQGKRLRFTAIQELAGQDSSLPPSYCTLGHTMLPWRQSEWFERRGKKSEFSFCFLGRKILKGEHVIVCPVQCSAMTPSLRTVDTPNPYFVSLLD